MNENTLKGNAVLHPSHYNQHPNGIECIEIIRHYTCDIANALKYLWRAGLKAEMGKEDADKEIEDLEKALWYIEDYMKFGNRIGASQEVKTRTHIYNLFLMATGYQINDVTHGYDKCVSTAMFYLMGVGLIVQGRAKRSAYWQEDLYEAIKNIQQRILDIERSQLEKEIESTEAVLQGHAVDGEDYVSKPGCIRKTEPEKYDPLNMVVAWGRVFSLSDEVRKKDNGALYSPCDNCDLQEFCFDDWRHPETSARHDLCRLHQAQTNEWYKEVGVARYSPRFGTVEVVDEQKEMELETKRLQED